MQFCWKYLSVCIIKLQLYFFCSHSDRFYPSLSLPISLDHSASKTLGDVKSVTILDLVIRLCADSDPATRKFACFAGDTFYLWTLLIVIVVGNSAFHSNYLYPYLPFSISFLCNMLNDSDEKTRANAAGAIGNLVRNGEELCEILCHSGAPGLLIMMSLYDPSVFTKVSSLFVPPGHLFL